MLLSNEKQANANNVIIKDNIKVEKNIKNGKPVYTVVQQFLTSNYTYDLKSFDGELIFEKDILAGVSINIQTVHNVSFNGNIFGTVGVINPGNNNNQIYVEGSIKNKGSLRSYNRVNTFIKGKLESGSMVVNKGKLTCAGAVEPSAKIIGEDIDFDSMVSPEATVVTTKIRVNLTENEKNLKEIKAKFKFKEFAVYEVELIVLEKMDESVTAVISNEIDDELDDFAQELENELSSESVVDETKKIAHKNVQVEESLSDLDDEEINSYIKHPRILNTQTSHQNSNTHIKSSVQQFSYFKDRISLPKLPLNQQSFKDRKKEIVQRIKDFNNLTKDSKQVRTANGKVIHIRKQQLKDLQSLEQNFEKGNYIGYFDEATGAGKTIQMLLSLMAMSNNGRNFDFKVLIVVSRTNLISQTIAEFISFYPNLSIGIVDGSHKKIGNDITITTYDSLKIQLAKEDSDLDKIITYDMFQIVKFDEAHHILAKNFHPLVPKLFNFSSVIGYSATPGYNTERDPYSLNHVRQVLPSCFGQYTICQGIDDGVLAPCHNVIVRINERINIQAERIKKSTKPKHSADVPPQNEKDSKEEADYSSKELNKHLNVHRFNRIVVLVIANGFNGLNGERLINQNGIIFGLGIENAKNLADLLNKYLSNHPAFKGKTPAAWISGNLSKTEKDRILKAHEDGTIPILANADMCIEGYNVKKDQYAINYRPTKSFWMAKQRGGRPLRKSDSLPNKVTFNIDFDFRIEQVFFNQFLDGHRTYGINKPAQKCPDFDDLITFSKEEIADFTIDSDYFVLAKPCVNKPKEEIVTHLKQPNYVEVPLPSAPDDDEYLYEVYDDPQTKKPNVTIVSQVSTSALNYKNDSSKKHERSSEVTNMAFSMFKLQESMSKKQKLGSVQDNLQYQTTTLDHK